MNNLLDWAQFNANSAMRALNQTATNIEENLTDGDFTTAHAEKLRELTAQLWAMEDLARGVEHALAGISAELRTGKQTRK